MGVMTARRQVRVDDLDSDARQRALKLHENATVVDTLEMSWVLREDRVGDVTAGGIDVLVIDILSGVWDDLGEKQLSFANVCRWIDHLHNCLEQNQALTLVYTVSDIERAKAAGQTAILLATQDMQPILETHELLSLKRMRGGFDWSLLRTLYRLGLRQGMACCFLSNALGAGCAETKDAGLTDLGIAWVREMNRLGLVIDANQEVSDQTSLDCAHYSEHPIILSHSNARSLHDIKRNAPDKVVKAVAEKGGVISIMPYAPEVTWRRDPGIEDLLDHVDHYANLVGPAHVGFGWDHTGGFSRDVKEHIRELGYLSWGTKKNALKNAGIDSLADTPKFTLGLVARGYTDDEITGILGGNVLRVYREVFGG